MHSDQLKEELFDLEQEADNLKHALLILEEKVKDKDARLRELMGVWSRPGLIAQKKADVERALREEADANATQVVWKEPPMWSSDTARVVRKITKKRIYIARQGEERMSYFSKDGTSTSKYDGVIDLELTFGENYEQILSGQ